MRARSVATVLAVAGALAGCSSSHHPAAATTTTTVTTTTTTVAPTSATTGASPTTVYQPSKPQTSPDAAAAALVSDWASGSRAAAATVASPQAVSTLFAIPYPGANLQNRGCTDSTTNPGTCTYRNTDTNGLYEIGVSDAGRGWYVSSVTAED